jgi:DNA-binding NtrC family response regulator
LRERKNDIDSLARYFVEKFNQRYSKQVQGLSAEATQALKSYRWPGNIRELENVLEHAFVLESGDWITREALPERLKNQASVPAEPVAELELEEGLVPMEGEAMSFRMSIQKFDFQASKEEFEKQFLINALRAFRGKINQTALHANIPKKTLLRKLEKYGITARDYN